MRLSRPCYDKPHRCPGWIGGGPKFGKVDRCEGGYIITRSRVNSHPGEHPFRFGHCNKCGVVTWPWATRKLSLFWWWDHISWRIEAWRSLR